MYILAVETSCDETSLSLLKGQKIIKCWTWTQIQHFAKFGGVVPSIASELHSDTLPTLFKKMITEFPQEWAQTEYVAYTKTPGLIGCLLVGEAFAKTISWWGNKKLIAINHLHAHIYAAAIENKIVFPAIATVISGGHTQIYHLPHHLNFCLLGETKDDAAGEVLDKIGREMGLIYPAGAKIEKLALKGQPNFKLNVYLNSTNFDFSFSGLKTHAFKFWSALSKGEANIHDFACSLQTTIIEVICQKISLAIKKYSPKTIILSGGVAANQKLVETVKKTFSLPVLVPPREYCTDNAAMVGILAYFQITKKKNKLLKKE